MKAPPSTKKRQENTKKTLKLEYKLLTPMMGGGAKTREADEISVIRPPTILGQLRFWWRACRAAAYPSLVALREAEDSIWGAMSKPSRIELWTERKNPGTSIKWDDPSIPRYVSFPLQPDSKKGIPPGELRRGVEFALNLRYPEELGFDLDAALWAWTLFGGVGARTRRGCGALMPCSDYAKAWLGSDARDFRAKIQANWTNFVSQSPIALKSVPHLTATALESSLTTGSRVKEGELVWKDIINAYKSIRQSRNGSAGRSHWPEPDTIRRLTGEKAAKHQPEHSVQGFPRAVYGLPIIFHFKDANDPADRSLEWFDGEKPQGRRASPLILKPVALSSGRALALGLVLQPEQLPGQLLLKKSRTEGEFVKTFKDWPQLARVLDEKLGLTDQSGFKAGPFIPILEKIKNL